MQPRVSQKMSYIVFIQKIFYRKTSFHYQYQRDSDDFEPIQSELIKCELKIWR
jgi:hypothetical protein